VVDACFRKAGAEPTYRDLNSLNPKWFGMPVIRRRFGSTSGSAILAKHGGIMHLRSKNTLEASGTAFSPVFPIAGAEEKVPATQETR
jgi:hypothetical protein